MPTRTLTRTAQRQIAALLSQAARAVESSIQGQADPAALAGLVESLQQSAADLDTAQAGAEEVPSGRTVSLKYAHQRLCGLSFLDGARIAKAKLFYQDEPVWAIYDDLRRVALFSGEILTGMTPETRLERRG